MNWAIAGLVYAGAYAALMTGLADQDASRLVAGNIALLLPPLAPLYVLATRRRAWRGRQAVFWGAIGAWAALWFLGQIGWAADELLRASPLPWFKWHIVLQLCGSALPLIALVAWPHRPAPAETAITVALDIAVLVFLTGFLYWSLIIAPANNPEQAAMGLRALAIIGPMVRLASVAGLMLAAASAGNSAWAHGLPAARARHGAGVRHPGRALGHDAARQLRHRIAGRRRLDAAVLLRRVGGGGRARLAGRGARAARRGRCRRRRRCCCSSRWSACRSSATACAT